MRGNPYARKNKERSHEPWWRVHETTHFDRLERSFRRTPWTHEQCNTVLVLRYYKQMMWQYSQLTCIVCCLMWHLLYRVLILSCVVMHLSFLRLFNSSFLFSRCPLQFVEYLIVAVPEYFTFDSFLNSNPSHGFVGFNDDDGTSNGVQFTTSVHDTYQTQKST